MTKKIIVLPLLFVYLFSWFRFAPNSFQPFSLDSSKYDSIQRERSDGQKEGFKNKTFFRKRTLHIKSADIWIDHASGSFAPVWIQEQVLQPTYDIVTSAALDLSKPRAPPVLHI